MQWSHTFHVGEIHTHCFHDIVRYKLHYKNTWGANQFWSIGPAKLPHAYVSYKKVIKYIEKFLKYDPFNDIW